jgi:repressor LexA
MNSLTPRQRQVLDFIRTAQQDGGETPSLREIAKHFGFSSMTAAADHVRALRRKGLLAGRPKRARSLRVVSPWQAWKRPTVDIPLLGAIPAGRPEDRLQEVEGCLSVDVGSLGIRPTARTFALQVHGDSMIGRHIMAGDYVILEHGMTPRAGDVVAALIDNESTLKTFVVDKGKPHLRAENPRYPQLIPAQELVIQGVMVALLRRVKPQKGN